MFNKIIPINELTNMVAIMQLDEDDKNLIIGQLNRYASVCGDALEVVNARCEEVCELAESMNREDDPDMQLTDSEEFAWTGLTAINGGDEDPRPEWYVAMWKGGKHYD